MKVLVCGGRDYDDKDQLFKVLDSLHEQHPFTQVISGKARGADALGEEWALARKVPIRPFPANWQKFGKAAGMIRNKQMLNMGQPDLVVAFPGGVGTKGMITMSKKVNIEVVEI